MAAQNPTIRRLAAQKAAQSRWKRASHKTASQLAEAQLADYIEKVVADAPPLSAAARSRLALLLGGPSNTGGAAP